MMANYTYHFFGAYFEIHVKARPVTHYGHTCSDGEFKGYPYRFNDASFCSKCGKGKQGEEQSNLEYPWHLVDEILPEEYENRLQILTPPGLVDNGVIYACDNGGASEATWLYFGPHDWPNPQAIQFPNTEEVEAMKAALLEEYQKEHELLLRSPLVESVKLMAGYVLNPEI